MLTKTKINLKPVICAENIRKSYRSEKVSVDVLKGINIAIHPGEIVAIMGPSGCGKTTLLNCLSGLDEVDEGEVYVEDIPIHTLSDVARTQHRAEKMGFIFQTNNLLPVFNVVENIELPLLVAGVANKTAREMSLAALDKVGLSDRATHLPAELSGGQQQRVQIARALVNEPPIIWADEPTGNLDRASTEHILSLIKSLNHENQQTFVIITHDTGVGQQCDRIIHLEDGRIVQ